MKGVLITRSGDNWYVIIQAEQEVSEPKKEGRSVGIDVGLDSFAVDSNGAVIENPRFYEHSRDRIKKLQQSVARKQRFSQNWKKAKGKLEKAYDHVTNRKNDFLHKLSRRYVDTYKTICVEDLQRRRSNICCLGISSYRAISDTITLSVPTASVR